MSYPSPSLLLLHWSASLQDHQPRTDSGLLLTGHSLGWNTVPFHLLKLPSSSASSELSDFPGSSVTSSNAILCPLYFWPLHANTPRAMSLFFSSVFSPWHTCTYQDVVSPICGQVVHPHPMCLVSTKLQTPSSTFLLIMKDHQYKKKINLFMIKHISFPPKLILSSGREGSWACTSVLCSDLGIDNTGVCLCESKSALQLR